jgi:hypothetical protein
MKSPSVFLLIIITTLFSCHKNNTQRIHNQGDSALENLSQMICGVYKLHNEPSPDSEYTALSLSVTPIWENDIHSKWLYVEKTDEKVLNQPVSQLIYQLTYHDENTIAINQFQIPNQAEYVGGSKIPEIFNTINPELIRLKKGCSIYLDNIKDKAGCYIGKSKNKSCKSTIHGVSYMTSKLSICKNTLALWDQGWSAFDVQAWGLEKDGYIFKKIKNKN